MREIVLRIGLTVNRVINSWNIRQRGECPTTWTDLRPLVTPNGWAGFRDLR
jgi:hypothetical protein